MGRLENIIARNRRPNQMRERVVVSLVFGAIVLLILGLTVFTDLGIPPNTDSATRASPTGSAPADEAATRGSAAPERDKRVRDVKLWRPARGSGSAR